MKKRLSRGILLALALIMAITAAPPTFADARYRLNNDVVWTNPDAACAADSGSSTTLSGDDNLAKIWNYLIEKGLNDQQTAGVLGNIAIESGRSYSPFTQEYARTWPAGGYGLVQWTNPGRRDAVRDDLKEKLPPGMFDKYYVPKYGGPTDEKDGYIHKAALAESDGKDANDKFLAIQLDFLHAESTTRTLLRDLGSGTEWDAVKAAKNLKEASDVWLFSFERPGSVISGGRVVIDTPSSIRTSNERAAEGQKIYDKLKGQSGTGSVSAAAFGGSGECSSLNQSPGSVKALQELVLKYADPKVYYHGDLPRDSDRTEEYVKAVAAAKSSGMYTGACNGIDCGAFVTLLLINSGWEPNYNYGGKFSNGAGNTIQQQAWMEKNWQKLGTGRDVEDCGDTAQSNCLQPGDVAINANHTFVYVGKIDGFGSTIASASMCGKAPSAGGETVTDSSMTWYRKKAGSGEVTGV